MIIVFGSINMDMFFNAEVLPAEGETVLCSGYEMSAGGKGANQALAAARMDEKVALVGRVGDDGMGTKILNGLRRSGVMTSGVAHSSLPTGCAVISRDRNEGRQTLLATGANADTSAEQVPAEVLGADNILLLQMDLPLDQNWELVKKAKENGATTILNLAPVARVPQSALNDIDYLIVNLAEAQQIAELLQIDADDDQVALAEALSRKGDLTCITTLGGKGSIACTKGGRKIAVPALDVGKVVDRSGASDAYCGTFAAALHKGMELEDAMRYASVAASLSCTKDGIQGSFAYLGEIEEHFENFREAS